MCYVGHGQYLVILLIRTGIERIQEIPSKIPGFDVSLNFARLRTPLANRLWIIHSLLIAWHSVYILYTEDERVI